MKTCVILGTRPEIIKNYSFVNALKENCQDFDVLYTNQHYDSEMSEVFFSEMGYTPTNVLRYDRFDKFDVGVMISEVMRFLKDRNIDLVTVLGDTSTALAGAIAGMYLDCGIAHIEAGLRSFDEQMVEERNRIMIDACSHYLFPYSSLQEDRLIDDENIRGVVDNVGNITIDVISDFVNNIYCGEEKESFFYITLHRKEFTDSKYRMKNVFEAINDIIDETGLKAILSLHPRTKAYIAQYGIDLGKIKTINPIGVFESWGYIKNSKFVMTDSGGVQEEACILKKPCITVRDNTERPETLVSGSNYLIKSFSKEDVISTYHCIDFDRNIDDVYGLGGAGRRMVDRIKKFESIYKYG